MWLRILSRVILIPVIAGVSYEILRLAGREQFQNHGSGEPSRMWMQGLTTTEPDDDMIEVAIAAVETVFDWRNYLNEEFPGWESRNDVTAASGSGNGTT